MGASLSLQERSAKLQYTDNISSCGVKSCQANNELAGGYLAFHDITFYPDRWDRLSQKKKKQDNFEVEVVEEQDVVKVEGVFNFINNHLNWSQK